MIWLSSIRHRVRNSLDSRPDRPEMKQDLIGILAFETAKTLSRLISIHKSLSDAEITKLRRDIMGSEGVRYLNSVDEGYLLRLACTEKIVDLDRVSLAVARLGKKCQEPGLHGFEHVYADMKLGLLDFGRLGFSPKEVGGKIAKMDKLVSATAELHTGLEVLAEMEVSERRLQSWKSFSGPIQVQAQKPNSELFEKKLAWQRSYVRRIRHTSLWNKSFDQIVSFMARAVCTVFARICYVFGPYVSDLPQVLAGGNVLMKPQHLRTLPRLAPRIHASGPLDRFPIPSDVFSKTPRPFSPKRRTGAAKLVFDFGFGFTPEAKKEGLFLDTAGPAPTRLAPASSTVGAASLAIRYANVIISAETLLTDPESMDAESREDMYQMLPARLRSMVREKMKRRCKKTGESDESLAEGWREGVGRIVGWLAPMAHDTIRWQMERNMERQEFESRPMVLLLQTLYYADKEKAEAAITEVLVGLSCMYHYGNRSDSSQKV